MRWIMTGFATVLALSNGLASVAVRVALRPVDVVKKLLDIVLGDVLLVASLPVLAVCAVIIKVSSRGPVFFKQTRVGQHGESFTIYKLRTMRDGAESDTGAVWAADNDPRVIGACRWMRWSHVDELPQLFNVFKGEMSLVGPRPERAEILADLKKRYPNVRKRLAVLPGITGLAQVRWSYDTTPERFGHKLAADLEYIEKRDLLLDLRILLATVPKFVDRKAK